MTPTPTQTNIMASLRSFLLAVLPAGVAVVPAQQNLVPEPAVSDFVVMTPTRFERLATNVDSYADCKFTGSISSTLLSVTAVAPGFPGSIAVGSTIVGPGVAAGTVVTALGTGTGGVGSYVVGTPQTVASGTLSAGTQTLAQSVEVTVQCDFHSANDTDAGDMAQAVSTMLRDDFGVQQFANQNPNYGISPLYADDPQQRPFINDQQMWEWRWVLEVKLQAVQVIIIPQQFADQVQLGLVDVS